MQHVLPSPAGRVAKSARCALLALGAVLPDAAGAAPALQVERLGEPVIEDANNYSENTRVRIRVRGWDGPIRVEEWNTQVYDGLHGATRLPLEVRARSGEVVIVLKSLARYGHFDMRNMPVPQIAVSAGTEWRLLQIPQWVDADGNDKTDWLERRVDDLLARARASGERPVARAAAALKRWEQSFKRDCGGFDEQSPGMITIAPACMDWDGVDSHRLNRGYELAATVLHEVWHVWSHAQSARAPPARRWPKAPPRVEPMPCPFGCSGQVWLSDPRYTAEEENAEAFAERYKHLFP